MELGYLKLWRKAAESEVFACPHLWRLWTWCLIRASYKSRSFPFKTGRATIGVKVAAGDFIFGRNSASEVLGESPSTIWDRMKKLEKMGMLKITSNKQYSMITICNWEDYQAEHVEIRQATDRQPTGNRQPTDTNKNKENKKNKTLVDGIPSIPCPHRKILEAYNSRLPSLPAVRPNLWNGQRAKDLQTRWQEDPERQNIAWWDSLFASILGMPFLLGEGERGWKADLGWIVKQKNLVKILEGGFMTSAKAKKEESEWGM